LESEVEIIVVGEVTIIVRFTRIVVVSLESEVELVVVSLESEVETIVLLDVEPESVPYSKSVVPVVDVVPFAQITVAEYVPLTQDNNTAVKLALSVLVNGLIVIVEVRTCTPLGLRTLIVACAEVPHAAEIVPLT
jgi:hypothetical protein